MFTPFLKEKVKEIVVDSFPLDDSSLDDLPWAEKLYLNDEVISRHIPNTFINHIEKFFKKELKDFIPPPVKCFVAGGSVMTYALYQNYFFINDIDIFPTSDLYYGILKTHLDKKAEREQITVTETVNARKYHFSKRIELIKRFSPSIQQLFNTFDFNVCKFGLEIENDTYTFSKSCSFKKLFNFELNVDNFEKYKTDEDKARFLNRLLKYTNKGFTLTQESQKEIFTHILNHKKNSSDETRQLREDVETAFMTPYLAQKTEEIDLPF